MKFLHLGDLHLGRTLGEFDLIEDQRYILEQVLEIAKKEKADGVLIAGDVYDKTVPSEAATTLLNDFLCGLAAAGVNTFIISGNHDSDDRLNYGSSLFESSRIFISSIFDGRLHKKTISDEFGEVDVYLLPFVKASQVRYYYPEVKIENYEDAVRTIIENTEIDASKRNVIVAHQFVTGGGEDPVLGGSEGVGTKNVGLVEKIGSACFNVFDYAALGHIHSPQRVAREEVRYSGSPLKYSLSEVKDLKSAPLVTLGRKGEVEIKLVPLVPKRDVRHLQGRLEELLDAKNVTRPDDYIYVTLTDEDIVNDAMGIFQQVYKNTVKLIYDNSHTRAVEHTDISAVVENKSFDELIADFYSLMYDNCEISEEEMKYMRMVAEEAGVVNEAD